MNRVVVATLRERLAMWEFIDARRALVGALRAKGWLEDVFEVRTTYLANGRNECVERFLETEATHLFFLDSDVIAPPGAVERLLSSGGAVVSGLYFQKIPPHFPEAYRRDGAVYKSVGEELRRKLEQARLPFTSGAMLLAEPKRMKVDAAGAGCLLIRRDILEKLPPRPFGPCETGYGEDIWFCRQAQEAGFDITLDWSVLCGHLAMLPIGQAQFRAATPIPKPTIILPGMRMD